jgi:gluconolactonase
VCSGSLFAAGIDDLVAPNAAAVKLVGDCAFTEGPAYSPTGLLLFSDIPNERIVRVDLDGSSSDFMKPSGKSNGLMFDAAGNLYACQGGARRVVKISTIDGKVEPLATMYEGKKLNSPNDLALDQHGGLYFTDPRYGDEKDKEQPVMGVYYISAAGKITRVIDSLQRPNGILVANDGKSLYVAEPNKGELYHYPLSGPGQVGPGKLIFTGDKQLDGGGPDGMALDVDGRVYTTYNGITVLSADGSLIGRIPVPEHPANCKFGGPDGKTLYITARTSLYSVQMQVAGAPLAAKGPQSAVAVSRRSQPLVVQPVSQKAAEELKSVKIEGVTLKIPPTWMQQEPSNKLRLAQFAIPAAEGDKENGELVISFFRGDGGGINPNLSRWTEQFVAEGRKLKLTKGACEQGAYFVSDLAGTYLKSEGGGPFAPGKKTPMAGYRSLSVILQVPDEGNYFLRLTGPEKTITAAAEAFRTSFGGTSEKEAEYMIER